MGVIMSSAFHKASNAIEKLKGSVLRVVVNVAGWPTGVRRNGAVLSLKTLLAMTITNRRVRPMVVFARKPLLRQPALLVILSARYEAINDTGWCAHMSVDYTPCKLNVSVSMAWTPTMITGR